MANIINITDKSPLTNTTKKIKGETVAIKTYLSADDFAEIVTTISNSCFNEGEYEAWRRPVATRYAMLEYFTDFDIAEIGATEIFKITQGKWFAEIEREITALPIWAEIEVAVTNQIDYRIATKPTAFDKLCSDLSAIITTDNTQNLADIKEVLNGLEKVKPEEFVKAAVDNAVKKK